MHLLRTKSAPSSLHACISLASALHQVYTTIVRFMQWACGFHASSTCGIRSCSPCLGANKERRKSEQGAEKCLRNLSRVIHPDVDNYPKIQVRAIKQMVSPQMFFVNLLGLAIIALLNLIRPRTGFPVRFKSRTLGFYFP
jgi:hypothetical protein